MGWFGSDSSLSDCGVSVDGVSEDLQKWYDANGCEMVISAENAAEKIGDYNAYVTAFADYMKTSSLTGTTPTPITITYNLENFTETANSLIGTVLAPEGSNVAAAFATTYASWENLAATDPTGDGAARLVFEKWIIPQQDVLSQAVTSVEKLKELWDDLQIQADFSGEALALDADEDKLADAVDQIQDGAEIDDLAEGEDAKEEAEDEAAEDEDKTDEEKASEAFSRSLFKEQCFLLAKIFEIVDHKKSLDGNKKLPYIGDEANASLLAEGDPFNFMNFLTQNTAQSAFFDMETKEISSLQPMIRLFKVGENDDGTEFQQEILFDAYASSADVESIFADKNRRGFGVGIKKFSFTYDGNNPFAAKKSIKAKLQIFSNSFSELLRDRTSGTIAENGEEVPRTYKYADLALKTSGGEANTDACPASEEDAIDQASAANLAKLNFRLKAVVGWAPPIADTSLFTTMSEDKKISILEALNESYVTLNLTPTVHDFDIDDMGRVNFTINYLAYVDDFFDQTQFNIFYDANSGLSITERQLLYKSLSKKCGSDQATEIKKADAATGAVKADKDESMRSLLRRLRQGGHIRYIPLSYEELSKFQTEGPFFEASSSAVPLPIADGSTSAPTADELTPSIEPAEDDETATKIMDIASEAGTAGVNHLGFFYVSDLVDVVLEGVGEYLRDFSKDGAHWNAMTETLIDECEKENEKIAISKFQDNFKKFRVVLGPIEIVNQQTTDEVKFISFGDIPISVKYFVEWLNEKMTKQEQVTYNLSKFLSDLFNNLIRNFLNDDSCFTFNIKQKVSLNQACVTSYKNSDENIDEITEHMLPGTRLDIAKIKSSGAMPLLNISGPKGLPVVETGLGNEINYLLYSAGRTRPTGKMMGVRAQDEEDGVFHYLLGRPRGIVKKIGLSKTESPGLTEVRFEQEGYDGLEQLRFVYDVNVECYANPKTFPGTYIYVDPRGFDPGASTYEESELNLTKYGIGGYCMIIRSENTFGPGEANTTLTAKWVAEINPAEDDDDDNVAPTPTTSGDGSASACDTLLTNREEAAEAAAEEDDVGIMDTVSSWFGG